MPVQISPDFQSAKHARPILEAFIQNLDPSAEASFLAYQWRIYSVLDVINDPKLAYTKAHDEKITELLCALRQAQKYAQISSTYKFIYDEESKEIRSEEIPETSAEEKPVSFAFQNLTPEQKVSLGNYFREAFLALLKKNKTLVANQHLEARGVAKSDFNMPLIQAIFLAYVAWVRDHADQLGPHVPKAFKEWGTKQTTPNKPTKLKQETINESTNPSLKPLAILAITSIAGGLLLITLGIVFLPLLPILGPIGGGLVVAGAIPLIKLIYSSWKKRQANPTKEEPPLTSSQSKITSTLQTDPIEIEFSPSDFERCEKYIRAGDLQKLTERIELFDKPNKENPLLGFGKYGTTLLALATEGNEVDIVAYLLKKGMSPATKQIYSFTQSPAEIARGNNYIEIVKLFHQHDPSDEENKKYLDRIKTLKEQTDNRHNNLPPSMEKTQPQQPTGKFSEFRNMIKNGDYDQIAQKIASNNQPNQRNQLLDITDPENGNNLLHCAIENNKTEIAIFLIQQGVYVDTPNTLKITPIKQAISQDKIELLNSMINESNVDTTLGLHFAAYKIKLKMVENLLTYNPNRNLPDQDGDTPLHHLMKGSYLRNPHITTIFSLLVTPENINARNKLGQTPLHIAVLNSTELDIIKLLINHGADPSLRTTAKNSLKDIIRIRITELTTSRRNIPPGVMQIANYIGNLFPEPSNNIVKP